MAQAQVIIRKARISDLAGIRPLYRDFLLYHARLDPLLAIRRDYREMADQYLRKTIKGYKTRIWVAETKGRFIGFVGAGIGSAPPIYRHRDFGVIFDAYVKPAYRRQGISRQLLREAYIWFGEKKIKRIELGVYGGNDLAEKTWTAHGFVDVSRRKRKFL